MLIPNADKNTQEKEIIDQYFYKHEFNNPQQNTSKLNATAN